jgi:hypothetical protein
MVLLRECYYLTVLSNLSVVRKLKRKDEDEKIIEYKET